MKAVVLCIFASFAGVAGSPGQAASAKSPACVAPEYRQFDFWIGDWDAFDVGGDPKTPVAHASIERILDGCALLEDYHGNNGSHGESFSIYDASRKIWHQSWVTNRGRLLVIEGATQAGAMVLSGTDLQEDGKERRVRGIWRPVAEGVRETAVTSVDGGKTWQPWFDLIFRPHIR